MVRWPEHNEPIRDDELWLFGYCVWKWPDSPYDYRKEDAYSDVVAQLNKRFTPTYGEYSGASVRRYIQLCRTDPKYRWHASNNKRYNQFDTEIRAYSSRHASEFGGRPEQPSDVPLYRKRMTRPALLYACTTILPAHIRSYHMCTGPISTADAVKRAKTLGRKEKLRLIAEFIDAYGPIVTRSGQLRAKVYKKRLLNRALSVLRACFDSDDEFMLLLSETRFVSKGQRPKRRYGCALHEPFLRLIDRMPSVDTHGGAAE
jgi:hypothetical protein